MLLIMLLYLPLLLFLYFITQNLIHKFQNLPPCPLLTFPVIGHAYLLKKPLHKTLHDMSNKYGPVFFLQLGSRPTLVVNSPSAAAECLSKANDAIFANRPRLLVGKHLGYNYTSIVWSPYGDHWRNLRRISSIELLSSHRIQSLSKMRLDEVRALIRHLFEVSKENPGSLIQVRTVIFELLFNSITRMVLGKRYYGNNEVNSEEAEEFQGMVLQLHQIASKSILDDFIPFLSWFTRTEDDFRALHNKRDNFFQELIKGIRGRFSDQGTPNEKGKTMIEVLLSLHETDPEYYTDDMIKSLTGVLIQASTDTSVATMEWAMTLLLTNPRVLNKVQTEIDNQVGPNRLINDSDLSDLPYLNCTIRETLRLHPVVPLLLPHESSQDCTIGGFKVPNGTILLVNVWAIQNDPKNWEDPEIFKPERFMVTKEDDFKYMPFGTGRRRCPGEALAMRMIGVALGSLVQCFDWKRMSDDDLEDVGEHDGPVASKARPLMAKCWPRPCMVDLLSQT